MPTILIKEQNLIEVNFRKQINKLKVSFQRTLELGKVPQAMQKIFGNSDSNTTKVDELIKKAMIKILTDVDNGHFSRHTAIQLLAIRCFAPDVMEVNVQNLRYSLTRLIRKESINRLNILYLNFSLSTLRLK